MLVTLKSSTTTMRQYDNNYETFIQSLDISITKHLFTGHEWNSSLIQPPTQTIPPGTWTWGIVPVSGWI